jgi:hypothetical protein
MISSILATLAGLFQSAPAVVKLIEEFIVQWRIAEVARNEKEAIERRDAKRLAMYDAIAAGRLPIPPSPEIGQRGTPDGSPGLPPSSPGSPGLGH